MTIVKTLWLAYKPPYIDILYVILAPPVPFIGIVVYDLSYMISYMDITDTFTDLKLSGLASAHEGKWTGRKEPYYCREDVVKKLVLRQLWSKSDEVLNTYRERNSSWELYYGLARARKIIIQSLSLLRRKIMPRTGFCPWSWYHTAKTALYIVDFVLIFKIFMVAIEDKASSLAEKTATVKVHQEASADNNLSGILWLF